MDKALAEVIVGSFTYWAFIIKTNFFIESNKTINISNKKSHTTQFNDRILERLAKSRTNANEFLFWVTYTFEPFDQFEHIFGPIKHF